MNSNSTGLEIAVIGLSGRFPGGDTIADFWKNLETGVELVSTFSDRQPQNAEKHANGSPQPNTIVKAGAVLQHVDQFDAGFFGFNPREAEAMDPQHRLFLECAWEALENAGYSSEAEERPIGVFAGVGMGTYLLYNLSPTPGFIESRGFLQTLVGVDKDYLPTRVSYKLNLKGPSISVGTACSSSLVAVHLACQSLLSGECDMALAAGVAVKVPQSELTLSPNEIASPDGHCRAFAHNANGTVGGNGIGVVVLKRLEDAIADRDHIYAVVKGSAMNNDGAMKVGYTAPSELGQARVIRAAQVMAEVEPETITYMETHGTGTALGDPIEIAAMTQAFRVSTDRKGFCAIGSVKTNVGHLDAAAGIAGFIKAVLALDRKQIPPSLNFEAPNAQIDFDNSPFYVNTQLTEWKANGTPRRAGVSSFGFGGTNAHAILEEAPAIVLRQNPETAEQRPYQLLALSAKTDSALETATTHLCDRLKQSPALSLADVAYTLQVGRWGLHHRRIVVAQSLADAVEALETGDSQQVCTGLPAANDPPVVFMFPGQGSQYVNMARDLYEREPIFQEECDRCFALLQSQHGLNLRAVLYPKAADIPGATAQLSQTAITQPALFVVEYALAKLWMSWGVQPRSLIGHSIGEYVAACLANVFSLKDALSLVAIRGQLMQQQPPGAMLAVSLAANEVLPWLNQALALAASNSPTLSVVSGAIEPIKHLQSQLSKQGIDCRLLHTSHAFHSQMMAGVMEPFIEQIRRIKLNPPQIPCVSNVTGTWMTAKEATDPRYWAKHLRQSVQFSQGIAELLTDSQAVFLEVGPGRTLSTLAKQQAVGRTVLTSLPHPTDKPSDGSWILKALGQLWISGVQIHWSGFYSRQQRHRVPLPTYPFERQRYWIDPPAPAVDRHHSASLDKKSDIADWFYIPSWKRSLAPVIQNLDQKRCWVVFVDRTPLAIAIVQRLQQQGHRVIQVNTGEVFSQSHHDVYTINPGDRDHYDALIQEILAFDETPVIAHLWTAASDLSLAATQTLGFYSLLYLAQALGQQNRSYPIHLGIVSSQLQTVTGDETIRPEKATILGPCKVIPQEYATITCGAIDVIPAESGIAPNAALIDPIITEILAQSSNITASVVAYRGSHRWLPTVEPMRLEATDQQIPLRSEGVYLITGGLGGIGLTLAEHLARAVQAKLVLISRSPLPPRSEWEQWLTTHDEDATALKIQKIQALEAIGAEVLVLNADVTDQAQMQAAVDRARQTFGQIHGIFHTAGVPGGGVIQLKTPAMAAQVMAPKVQGTQILSQIFQQKPPDFLLLFSSISAILGGAGQVDYCAANCFLDAFAHSPAAKLNAITINWDTWQEIGMAANLSDLPEAFKQQRLESLKSGIAPHEGLEGLNRILQRGCNQVIVSTKEWQAVLEQKHDWQVTTETLNAAKPEVASGHQRSLQSTVYVAPSNEIEHQIAELWQEQLGIAQVGIHDNFFELGGHSLLAVRVVSRLRERYPVELSLRTLLSDAPTIAGIAAVIAAQLTQPTDATEMDRILAEIEQLSLDEVQVQLAQEPQANV
jgi:acyl transferase domain-containing protein/acyl carrier protein